MKKIHKKQMRIVVTFLFSILTLVVLNDAFGRHKVASSGARFDRALEQEYVVALLYVSKAEKGVRVDKSRVDKSLRGKIKNLRRTFKRVSKSDPYNYAEVMFVTADVSKGKLSYIPKDYKLEKPLLEQPVFILFKNGKQIATSRGFLSAHDQKEFIDKYFRKDIAELVKQKEATQRRKLIDARKRAYDRSYRWAPYWGYGYGWPYRSWGYGFGWGHRGWGHRGWW